MESPFNNTGYKVFKGYQAPYTFTDCFGYERILLVTLPEFKIEKKGKPGEYEVTVPVYPEKPLGVSLNIPEDAADLLGFEEIFDLLAERVAFDLLEVVTGQWHPWKEAEPA